jgi:putative glycosyltransferase (TIGR04348 family)
MSAPSVVIVSPALAGANNGNWQTANRWREMLAATHRVRVTAAWPDGQDGDDAMLALHARKSADAVLAWVQVKGSDSLAVVLTGTDLYHDVAVDPRARRSLGLASRLVVLQALGLQALAPDLRAKARVIYQSTTTLEPVPKGGDALRAVMVGHLRSVKSPRTLFEAARLLHFAEGIRIDHIGEASETELAGAALDAARDCPHYRWLGGLPHSGTREAIRSAHVLVHASAMEGGAHVVMEAVCSGTPVLASRVDGNVGMLGEDYEGYFEHGDAEALAAMLRRCRRAPDFLERLREQCDERTPLFDPRAEQRALLRLLGDML